MYSPVSALDTAPVSLTQKALNQNFNLEEKQRREIAVKNKDYYYGKQEQDLILANEDVDPLTMNLVRPIMTKRTNMLYSRPLKRNFTGPAVSVALLEQIYKDNSIDALLQKADLMAELTGSCLIHPLYDETLKGKYRLVLYDASEFSAAGNDNDPTTADAVSLLRIVDHVVDNQAFGPNGSLPQTERVVEQQVWTTESVSFFTGPSAAPVQQTSMTHNLGFLPFVNFKGEEVHNQYIGYPQASPVVNMNRQINQMLTHLAYMVKMQSFTPIAISGYKNGESITWNPGHILSLPSEGAATALSINPKINEVLVTLQWLEDRLYVTSSVPKISVEGGEGATSGRELMIRWFPLMQVFQEKTVRYERYELQLANLILAMNKMPMIDDVMIDWPEETIMPFNPEDENLERNLRLNLTSVVEELMRRNPQLDEDEATITIAKNTKLNQEINADAQTQTERDGSTASAPARSEATDRTRGGS